MMRKELWSLKNAASILRRHLKNLVVESLSLSEKSSFDAFDVAD